MRFAAISAAALCAVMLAATPAGAQQHQMHDMKSMGANEHAIHMALADPARPEADKARDVARHPAELLTFMGVKPGDKVADFFMGGGYWTRILAPLVGKNGKVYAYQPGEAIARSPDGAQKQDAVVKPYANAVANRDPLASFSFPEKLDGIITVENWHDLHLARDPAGTGATVARELYKALKPGGVLLVVDHVGIAGATPFAVADTLHRGDAAATKAEIEGAGFKLAATSPLYANPADPHTAKVFDPSIRGKTDQFVYKFVKP
ncbi:methyltransferase [uncultured Sphingomonas sp.]|uniref:class I SAM-dependent methyltransferase n=1 Tax=uncultured Sphingomonas sp. TaxID=158754 RepID=UPI002638E27F|nr:methyltransferase [uncultured Sphingomonas sp.]